MKHQIIGWLFFVLFAWNGLAQTSLKEEFVLETTDGIKLAGEIEYPNQKGKFPAAILIWGSGPHTRDQVISGTPIFKQIAEELIQEGMFILRMDKRGYGKSTGAFQSEDNYTTRDLAKDIKLAYDYLNVHPLVDTTRIGLIGHSEGSIIASILGSEEKGIDWLILFGPSAVSGKEVELAQGQVNRKALGITDEVNRNISVVWDRYIEFIKGGYQNDSLYYDIGKAFLMAHGLEESDERINPEFIDQLLDAYKTPWYQYFYNHDNRKFLEQIKIPVLAILGGADQHTSVDLHLLPLYNALQKANNKDYKIVILADEDHFFFRFQGERLQKHQFGAMKMSPKFLSTMKSWLKERLIVD